MNARQKRTLFTLLALVAVLVAVLLAVRHGKQRAAEAEAEAARSAAQSGVLTDGGTAYTALSYHNGSTTLSFALNEDGAWYWTNDPGFPLDQAYLLKLTNLLSSLKPQQTITDGDTLEAYGLTEPSATLTASEEGGAVTTLALGKTTTDGNSYYMLMNGRESPVYIVSNALYQAMSPGIYEMCLLPDLPEIAEGAVSAVHIAGAAETLLTAAPSVSGQAAAAGSASGSSSADSGAAVVWRSGGRDVTAQAAPVLSQLLALSFRSCVDYRPTDDAVSLCGFDEPAATVSVAYTGAAGTEETLTLTLANPTLDGAGRYVRWNDDSTIYSIAADSLDAVLDLAANGLSSADAGAATPEAPPAGDTDPAA